MRVEQAATTAGGHPGERAGPGELSRGTVVGRYTVLSLLGRGGMSEVYGAYDPELDRKIALKVLHPRPLGSSPEQESRLLREARAIAQISHPNVIAVHDVGTFGDRVFVAITFVEGKTLRDWLADRPRTRGAIMAVFADAARGLAAAHDKGLVHRDFKPQNVLVGADGIVRVTDFGLARWSDELPEGEIADSAAPRVLGVDLTKTGQIAGTPLYMAPEQVRGQALDARADQFSFCVALYEALYGEHPFFDPGAGVTLAEAVTGGRLRAPPPRSNVPGWLRRVVLRGLSIAPSDRWPSMSALLAALARDPARVRRWLAAGAGVLACSIGLLAAARNARIPGAACEAGAASVARVWSTGTGNGSSASRRAGVKAAFLATGVPTAAEVWEHTAAVVDRYVGDWGRMSRDNCEATQVRHDQAPAVFERRVACLGERRGALEALLDVFATADATMMSSAVDAAVALPGLDLCADLPALSREEGPRDAEVRTRVDDLRRQALKARALHDAGRDQPAIVEGRRLVKEARTIGYAPLTAELLEMTGFFQSTALDPEAHSLLEEALWTALRTGRDEIAAHAAALLTGVNAFHGEKMEEAQRWSQLAGVLVDRLGPGHERLRSWVLNDRAVFLMNKDLPASLRLLTEVLAIKRRILPPGDPDIGRTLISEAEGLHRSGNDAAAVREVNEALRLLEAAYGPNNVTVAFTMSNRGEYLAGVGRTEEALASFRESLARWQVQVHPDEQYLAYPLTGMGEALFTLGRRPEARAALEQAWRIRQASEGDPAERGDTAFALARTLWAEGDRGRALALAKAARRNYEERAMVRQKSAHDVALWIAQH